MDDRLLQRLVGNGQQRLTVIDQHHYRHDQNHEKLGERFQEFGQGIHREHALDP
ncbi:hypothetical protein D3C76_1806370 [compost metagenome]